MECRNPKRVPKQLYTASELNSLSLPIALCSAGDPLKGQQSEGLVMLPTTILSVLSLLFLSGCLAAQSYYQILGRE